MTQLFPFDCINVVRLGLRKRLLLIWPQEYLSEHPAIGVPLLPVVDEHVVVLKDHLPFDFQSTCRQVSEFDTQKHPNFASGVARFATGRYVFQSPKFISLYLQALQWKVRRHYLDHVAEDVQKLVICTDGEVVFFVDSWTHLSHNVLDFGIWD